MRIKEIVKIPDESLRHKASKVDSFDEELISLAKKMVEMMRQYDGVGLAAPQIGISKKIVVVEYCPKEDEKTKEKGFPLTILINPTITKTSTDKVSMVEGCLSLPGLEMEVKRPKEINVTGQDLNGKQIKIRAKGLLARVLQHEIDHLNGILFTDYAKGVRDFKNYADLRCVFIGTPEFAVPALDALIVNNANIVGVITETDKPAGRKMELQSSGVKKAAEEFGLPVYQPSTKRELEDVIEELDPDYIVVAAFGQILTKKMLNTPDYGIINIHPSLLPKYRGASPIQSAILHGEEKTGVTIMKLDEGMDEGDIVSQEEWPITEEDTTESLTKKLWVAGANLLIKTLPLYFSNQLKPKKQEGEATYSKLIHKEDGCLDFSRESPQIIERKIRAYYPWPKAFFMIDGKRVIIQRAHLENSKIIPEIVQLEGKNPTNWKDFLRGFKGNLPSSLM